MGRKAEINSVVASALPPPSGNKLAKPWVSDPIEPQVDGVPASCSAPAYRSRLVTQRIEARGHDQRGRQPRECVGQQRRNPRIGRSIPEPPRYSASNQSMSALVSRKPSANRLNDLVLAVKSVRG